jgi:hypothetical protein
MRTKLFSSLALASLAAAGCSNHDAPTTPQGSSFTINPCSVAGTLTLGVAQTARVDCSNGGTTLTLAGNGASYLVVETGPWIFGRKVMLPAGVVTGIDHENKRVVVDRTQEQIKNAPAYDESVAKDAAYRDELDNYYGQNGAGWNPRG